MFLIILADVIQLSVQVGRWKLKAGRGRSWRRIYGLSRKRGARGIDILPLLLTTSSLNCASNGSIVAHIPCVCLCVFIYFIAFVLVFIEYRQSIAFGCSPPPLTNIKCTYGTKLFFFFRRLMRPHALDEMYSIGVNSTEHTSTCLASSDPRIPCRCPFSHLS